ncbi:MULTISPECIES: 2-amino-4-hydroxy-6-hydroxymethyldihydropteridine diphosphokinase [Lysobacter]|uniref:2-amino-4-hydroxy-6-hydroxymethyldihydropteridine diphosphokinase n=1 Tax=Lysobacter firmicutimachus TaxID=1792846 RepID=A0ABU8D3Q7_9GAMM|nr:2-amino-4-hydroxy-6-hydroxymethyldihydropteridine diphosphokinase [Lysobacter antibioticus]
MSAIALICLGACDGARVENLIVAAARLCAEAGPHGLRGCSDLFADRHRDYRGGVTVNLMLALQIAAADNAAALERRFKQIESDFGRRRDPQRALPVPLDIDLVGLVDTQVRWQPRYDPGRPYLFHGLYQLPLPALKQALDTVAAQRGFVPQRNAEGFYSLAGAGFVERWLRSCDPVADFTAEAR